MRIGLDIGLPSWDDKQEILRYLHRSKQVTFFTRDSDFFRYRLSHPNHSIVVVDIALTETAETIRRFLRHPHFKTKAQRINKVIKLLPKRIIWFEGGKRTRKQMNW